MKTKLLALFLLLVLLLSGCAGESALLVTSEEKTETDEKKTEAVVETGEVVEVTAEETLSAEETLPTEEDPAVLAAEREIRNGKIRQALAGKNVSFIGDSISTFDGYSNNGEYNSTIVDNAIYYPKENYGFTDVNETWWMQTCAATGMNLLVNNSWSGDRVTVRGVGRALQLHNDNQINPDVIVVYLGINDFRRNVSAADFKTAYDKMISGMKEKYPQAEIYLCNLVYTSNVVDHAVKPPNVVKFNEVIESIAVKHGASLVDLYNGTGITWRNVKEFMADGSLHPNYAGMDLITECVLNAFGEKYAK